VAALTLTAACATFTYVWNFDIHWHLASGQWMLQHKAVLDHDPFSIDPPGRWLNTHWLFQVIAAAIFAVGGWPWLTVLKSSLCAGAMLAFGLALRRRVPAGWLVVSGLALLYIMQVRFRVRPEAFSLTFLLLTILLIENVRQGGATRKLWWLAPLMLVWANIQGLFMLGLAILGSSLLGALLDRRLRRDTGAGNLLRPYVYAPLLSAAVACLLTPWPVDNLLYPFLLVQRISGKEFYYSYVVSELQPTHEALSLHGDAVALVLCTGLVMLLNHRRVPLAHVAWLGAFIYLGLLARRNVALLGPVAGYLLAIHGADLLKAVAARRPRLGRVAPFAAGLATLLALAVSAGYATEWYWRTIRNAQRFGAWLQEDNYPTGIARWLESLKAGGDVFTDNFGDAAVFIYYSGPRDHPVRKVFIDGRNEFHTLEQFIRQHTLRNEMRDKDGAAMVDLPSTVRFLFIRFDAFEQLAALSQNPWTVDPSEWGERYRLVRVEPGGVCFARKNWPGGADERAEQNLPAESNLGDYDLPLGADGLIQGFPVGRRTWRRQNPPAMTYRVGAMFASMGRLPWSSGQESGPMQARLRPTPVSEKCLLLGVRYLTAAQAEDLAPRPLILGGLAMAHVQRAFQFPGPESAPVDINLARALWLFRQLGIRDLNDFNMQWFVLEHVRALILARQLDGASKVINDLLDNLPPKQRVYPPYEYSDLRNYIRKCLRQSEHLVRVRGVYDVAVARSPTQRAAMLMEHDVGLAAPAIAELRAAPGDDANAHKALGDLLLGSGRAAEAREAYARLRPAPPAAWELSLRLILCDWTEGRLEESRAALDRLVRQCELASRPPRPDGSGTDAQAPPETGSGALSVVTHYRDELKKQMGR
jgi:hypothetical protein